MKKTRPFPFEKRLHPFSWNRTAATASVHFLHSFCNDFGPRLFSGAILYKITLFCSVVNPEGKDFLRILHSAEILTNSAADSPFGAYKADRACKSRGRGPFTHIFFYRSAFELRFAIASHRPFR